MLRRKKKRRLKRKRKKNSSISEYLRLTEKTVRLRNRRKKMMRLLLSRRKSHPSRTKSVTTKIEKIFLSMEWRRKRSWQKW